MIEAPLGPVPAGRVRLRFRAGGICGSDLHYCLHGRSGPFELKEPLTLGHEIVVEVGADVRTVTVGACVAVDPSLPPVEGHEKGARACATTASAATRERSIIIGPAAAGSISRSRPRAASPGSRPASTVFGQAPAWSSSATFQGPMTKDLDLRGSFRVNQLLGRPSKHLRTGGSSVESRLTARFPLAQAREAVEPALGRKPGNEGQISPRPDQP